MVQSLSLQKEVNQPRPVTGVKTGKTLIDSQVGTYHDIDMFQSLPQPVSPFLPDLIRAARIAILPNAMQTRMSQTDDAEEVVEEVRKGPPTEVFRRIPASPENPM